MCLLQLDRNIKLKKALVRTVISMLFLSFIYSHNATAAENEDFYSVIYKPSKVSVLKTLDKMGVEFELDSDGDVYYTLNDKSWKGYVIFSHLGTQNQLWSLQVRTQFATKTSYYEELLEFANHWNANNKCRSLR